MKWTFLLLITLLFSACAELARIPASDEAKHVVFDIDWTIVSEIKTESPQKIRSANRIIEVQDHKYFIHDGLEEFIQNILDKKDVKISFFSGGTLARNNELLSKIKLKDNRSLKDIAYKVLHFEDLVAVDAAPGTIFSERFKKDLSKISTNFDQLIMFDDTYNFVLETKYPQTQNVFFIGSAFEHFEKFSDTKGLSGKYVPASHEEWLLDKHKLSILNAAFEEAYAETKASGIGFAEAMKKKEDLLNLKSRQWNEYSLKYFKKKNQIDLAINPQESFKCSEGMKVLMGF